MEKQIKPYKQGLLWNLRGGQNKSHGILGILGWKKINFENDISESNWLKWHEIQLIEHVIFEQMNKTRKPHLDADALGILHTSFRSKKLMIHL